MENLNKSLILTLKQDLHELNKVNDAIKLRSDSRAATSWFCEEASTNTRHSSDNLYLISLELIVDRLYVVLRNIINYIDENNEGKKSGRNVRKPPNVTLGCVANLLWQKILIREEDGLIRQAKEINCDFQSAEVQTDIQTLSICDSCFIAKDCIKSAASEIENTIFQSSVSLIKNEIKEKIFDITQSACMKYLTDAIVEDVKDITKLNAEIEYKQQKLLCELSDVKKQLEASKLKLSVCEWKRAQLENKSDEVQGENEILKKKCTLRTSSYNQCKRENEDLTHLRDNLQQRIGDLEENLKAVQNINEGYKCNVEELNRRVTQLSVESYEWKIKYYTANSEKDLAMKMYEDMKSKIDDIERELAQPRVVGVNSDIRHYYEAIVRRQDEFKQEIAQIKKLIRNIHKQRSDLNLLHNNLVADCKVKGDPFTDMKNQLEVNEQNIDILQRQNDKLKKVLRRFIKNGTSS